MKGRGIGYVYQPVYVDKKSGEKKVSAVWWIQYCWRGRRYRESTNSTRRSEAQALLKRRLGEIGQGKFVGASAEKVTFEDLAVLLLDDYKVNGRKSIERAEGSTKRLREFFGQSLALDISADRVNIYIRLRQEAGAENATIQKELAALKRMFTLAVQCGRLSIKPYLPTLKVSNVRQGFFEEPEFQTLMAKLPEHLKPVAHFAYLTGWRKSEIVNLLWCQVDFVAGIIRLEPGTTKNNEGREFPFAALPALADLLRRQREYTDAVQKAQDRIVPWTFHRNGEPVGDFKKAWQTACRAALIPGRLFHDFRRTAVRNLERASVPRSVAMKLTGHKTEAVYRRYAITSQSDLREGVAKLASMALSSSSAKVQPKSAASGNGDVIVSTCK
ncbi:MAG: tyrosine-type recombinase/integrase [Planctomycetes bacterium]|nr:tyrosine-type recombinase/integrase [Planctomycetota bacterium]